MQRVLAEVLRNLSTKGLIKIKLLSVRNVTILVQIPVLCIFVYSEWEQIGLLNNTLAFLLSSHTTR